ncbi:alpha/beta hydrolase [Nonomuraea sp. NPDC050786]|uniref:alpha/beta fold hydrolase n=1 Tax=Nonomuraea sp. NPDC050786 TaxID=3154840 RepID=UPI003404B3F9
MPIKPVEPVEGAGLEEPTPDTGPAPKRRRRWLRWTLAVTAAFLTLLSGTALYIAYIWQPSATHYDSPYMAQIESRYVDTPVATFHYTKTGQGSPVVLIAGGGMWVYSYRNNIRALTKDHTVYAVDLPGQGYTTLKQRGFDYSLDAMSGALSSFLDAVGLQRSALVGHSWGGAWSLYFTERHPERVSRLILIDSTGLDIPSTWDWRPLEFPVVGELIGKLMTKDSAAGVLGKAFAKPGSITPQTVDEDWAPMSRPENRRALWMSQRNLDYSVTQNLMGQVHAPTLILWGGSDRFDKPSEAADMAQRIPGATADVLPGCGHNAHEECPDQANPLMAGFCGPVEGETTARRRE